EADQLAEAFHAHFSAPVTLSWTSDSNATNYADFVEDAELDVYAYHLRTDWEDSGVVGGIVSDLQTSLTLPVYIQETLPTDHGSWDKCDAALSLQAAISQGAAAWNFHTRRSFGLNSTRLFNLLVQDELDVLNALGGTPSGC